MTFFRLTIRSAALGLALTATLVAASTQPLGAQQDAESRLAQARAILATESYAKPAPEVASLVTAPRHLNVSLTSPSPDRTRFLKEQSEGLPSVNVFGKKHHYFAGLQVDPAANRARALTTRGAAGLQFIDATTGATTTVQIPAGATVSSATWSPAGKQLAFIANFESASHVYVADAATGRSRPVTRTPLLATAVTSIDWTADGRHVIAVVLPAGRGAEPERPAIATGPQVRLWTDGKEADERNWASLLEDPFDVTLMEYFVTGQLVLVDVRNRSETRIGAPAMIKSVDASPDGQYFRVTTLQKPFSYVVPWSDFGTREEIWNREGAVVAEISKEATRVANDTTRGPFGQGRQDARRGLDWMPQGAGLFYIASPPRDTSAANGNGNGDTAAPPARGERPGGAARPDRLVRWLPPFGETDTSTIYSHNGPISSVTFTDDATGLFVASTRSGTGEIVHVSLDTPGTRHTIARLRGWTPGFTGDGAGRGGGGFGRRGGSPGDSTSFYENPGAMLVRRGTNGGPVALVSEDGAVFLSGTRYHRNWQENAPRAFVDKVTIATGDKTRLFDGSTDAVETVGTPLDDNFARFIITRETTTQVPNAFLRTTASGTEQQLTENVDRAPAFTKAIRKRVFVTRADGVKFLVNVTLPADYTTGTRLPGMLWFYPYEYTSQGEYDRTLRAENIHRFPTSGTRTIEYLVTQGYAVANFDPPIIGDQGRMNDNYVADLRMNLLAVIDELDRQGYIDRTKLGIGGHSYGAFSTANALVHTPFFKAGIAGDGMYNRTLTPTGFQSERRNLWSGQRTYLELSPMLYAERMQGALLMYHGLEDQNVGTAPISSIRMMQALRAEGKTAALYMYPYEDHGPATEETLLDLWARWTAWLDVYVKHAGEQPKKETVAVTGTEPASP